MYVRAEIASLSSLRLPYEHAIVLLYIAATASFRSVSCGRSLGRMTSMPTMFSLASKSRKTLSLIGSVFAAFPLRSRTYSAFADSSYLTEAKSL